MKTNVISTCGILLIAATLLTNCKKETAQISASADNASAAKSENFDNCRVTQYYYYDAIHNYEQIDNYTYKNGLVDEWTVYYGEIYKMEYGTNGKMKKARGYFDGRLYSTIEFIYKNNKVVKEIWYQGNTQTIDDEVINTYNNKGQMIKNESINYDYYTLYIYTPQGEIKSWLFFTGGKPVQKADYTFNKEIKNPLSLARPGIEYSFGWPNSAFGAGNRWYSSEKSTIYDEAGNPSTYYDLDPMKTEWTRGSENYPLLADYVDILTGGSVINSFEYENCNGKNDELESKTQKNRIGNKIIPARDKRYLMQGAKIEIIKKKKN